MGADFVVAEGSFFGYCLNLEEIIDIKTLFLKFHKSDEFHSHCALDEMFTDWIIKKICKSWNKSPKTKTVECSSNLEFYIFYESFHSTYEAYPAGKCKLLWGFPFEGPKKATRMDSECEEYEISMTFPLNSCEIIVDFLTDFKIENDPKNGTKNDDLYDNSNKIIRDKIHDSLEFGQFGSCRVDP